MFAVNNLPFALPHPPVLSSQNAGWEDIQLALFRQPPSEIPKHRLQFHTICINLGSPVILEQCVDGLSQQARSTWGDMSFYSADLWQAFRWDKETEFLQLYLEPKFLQQVSLELEMSYDFEELLLLTRSDKLVLEIALALKNHLAEGNHQCRLYIESMTRSLAIHLLTLCRSIPGDSNKTTGLSQKQTKQVMEYIRNHLPEDLSLSELAACIALSPYHFARLFKQTTGITPHQYVICQRVEKAKELLRQRELSVTEIALVCGFAHQGHLSKHFKRIIGLTPTAFRENL
jgi:AraC family transcriptional regulator